MCLGTTGGSRQAAGQGQDRKKHGLRVQILCLCRAAGIEGERGILLLMLVNVPSGFENNTGERTMYTWRNIARNNLKQNLLHPET